MSIAAAVRHKVAHIPKGQPFVLGRVAGVGSRSAVSKALADLVRKGVIRRVIPGVFVRPEFSRLLGESPVNLKEVVSVVARARGETLQIHGSEAARHFRLSTQMQIVATYYTSGPTRTFQLGQSKLSLVHARPEVLQHAGTHVGAAISLLYYLAEEEASETSLRAITCRLNSSELETLRSCTLPKWAATLLRNNA